MTVAKDSTRDARTDKLNVGLFVTCLVDLFRPNIGFSALKLLEEAHCNVSVPLNQTCCGQPAYNSGDQQSAKALAKAVIESFEGFDYVVAPSGSCAGMLKHHYPQLFAKDKDWYERSKSMAEKVYELTSFLVDIVKYKGINSHLESKITYHDSCAGLREMGIHDQPRTLLSQVEGLELVEMEKADVCCGFGGLFSVKFGEISNAIVSEKCDDISACKPDMVLAGDLGCLMNIAGKLKRQGSDIPVRHIAEILAGNLQTPPIGGK